MKVKDEKGCFLEIAGHFLYTINTLKKREEGIDNDCNNNGTLPEHLKIKSMFSMVEITHKIQISQKGLIKGFFSKKT